MNATLNNDHKNFANLVDKVKNQGIAFVKNISNRPTSSKSKAIISDKLNVEGIGSEAALALFNQKFEPGIVASTGPRYWGFVTGGSTPASTIGDILASFYDQNTQAVKGQGDISAIIEKETIQLLLDLFSLPNNFLGGFVTGATMSNFTCLAVARQWIGKQFGLDFAKNGISKQLHILSALPHSSTIKSLAMLGIGSNNIIKVEVIKGNREAIDIQDLTTKIEVLNNEPFILIASAGTVNTVDFDDLEVIATLKQKYNFWLHVDAAFGAFAALSPQHSHLLKGWEAADSITIDCHKWLNVPYESAFFFIKEQHKLMQTETFQNSNAPYLGDPLENFNFLNFLPENSRRLRALPAWFTLIAYGKNGYIDIVENSINMAQLFAAFIATSKHFELLAPLRLNNVCFTLRGQENQNRVVDFLKDLNDTGKVFMTPTIYNNKKGIRAAFVNWRTAESDIELVKLQMEKIIYDNNYALKS